MYNGIGLTTLRGTATNGYVQRNLTQIGKGQSKPNEGLEETLSTAQPSQNRPLNRDPKSSPNPANPMNSNFVDENTESVEPKKGKGKTSSFLAGFDVENAKFENCLPRLSDVMTGMLELKPKQLLSPKYQGVWMLIAKYTSASIYPKVALVWNNELGQIPFVQLYSRMWEGFWNQPGVSNVFQPTNQNFYFATSAVWSSSDTDDGICAELWKNNLPALILKRLASVPDFSVEVLNECKGENYFCKAFLSIVMNALRRCQDHIDSFRSVGGVEEVMKYLKSKDEIISVMAGCTVAYAINEDQMSHMSDGPSIINFLWDRILEKAIKKVNRRYRGFSIEEILHALEAMADQEKVQDILGAPDKLELLLGILKQPKEEDELVRVSKLMWKLSFKETVRNNLMQIEPNSIQLFEGCATHMNPKISKSSKGTVWNLKGIGSRISESSEKKAEEIALSSYVMVSYDWKHKDLVLPLNSALNAAGLRTWIDVEKMSGSTLEAMADAVEHASIILVCISERYKESPNCRAEAEYAFRLNKPILPIRTQASYKPDGWLGMLLGTKLYFNCFQSSDIKTAVSSVIEEIKRSFLQSKQEGSGESNPSKNSTNVNYEPKTQVSNTSSARKASPLRRGSVSNPRTLPNIQKEYKPSFLQEKSLSGTTKSEIKSWSTKETVEFLSKKKVLGLSDCFLTFNGRLLHQLFQQYVNRPQIFLAVLDSMKISGANDILLLTEVLDELTS